MNTNYLPAILVATIMLVAPLADAQSLAPGAGSGNANGMPDGLSEIYRGPGSRGIDPNAYARPPGNVIYRSAGPSCVVLANTTPVDVFPTAPGTIEFTTSPATNFIEIQYSGQYSLGNGTLTNRAFFRCSVSQDGGTTFIPCSGIGTNGYIMARRVETSSVTPFALVTSSGGYTGFVSVQPSTPTIVKLDARLEVVNGAVGTACFSNAIVRY
jgi:hypothetical protein